MVESSGNKEIVEPLDSVLGTAVLNCSPRETETWVVNTVKRKF